MFSSFKRADGWAEGEGLGMDVRGSKGFVELLAGASKRSLSLTLLSQRLNARGGEGAEGAGGGLGFEFVRGGRGGSMGLALL